MRLIDADALINNLEMLIEEQEEDDHVETWNNAITCAINEVKHHAPTVEPPKGRWIQKPNIFGVAYCSECDYELHTDDTNFCPNCGADMREREDNYNYERAVEQLEHDMLYEPTFNPNDGSM